MNLNVEICHTQYFLSDTLNEMKSIFNSSIEVFNSADKIDIYKEDGMYKLRKKVNDYKDDTDDDIKCILMDYEIFQKEMKNLIKNRDDESIKKSLSKYTHLHNVYKETYKKYKKIYKKLETTVDRYMHEKKYNKFLYLNKITFILYKALKIMEGCKYGLEKLLDIETKKEEES